MKRSRAFRRPYPAKALTPHNNPKRIAIGDDPLAHGWREFVGHALAVVIESHIASRTRRRNRYAVSSRTVMLAAAAASRRERPAFMPTTRRALAARRDSRGSSIRGIGIVSPPTQVRMMGVVWHQANRFSRSACPLLMRETLTGNPFAAFTDIVAYVGDQFCDELYRVAQK